MPFYGIVTNLFRSDKVQTQLNKALLEAKLFQANAWSFGMNSQLVQTYSAEHWRAGIMLKCRHLEEKKKYNREPKFFYYYFFQKQSEYPHP